MSASWSAHSRVFVDTSAYFTVTNARDNQHQAMSELLRELVAARRRLITTNFVLAEVHALLLNRINRAVALRALDEIDASRLTTVVRISRRDE